MDERQDEQVAEMPVLRVENGATVTEVVINLDRGFGTIRGNGKFVLDCNKYQRRVCLKKDNLIIDAKSIMSSFRVGGPKGTKLEIIVEGEDDLAEAQALRMYSALTSGKTYDMDFDRYTKK